MATTASRFDFHPPRPQGTGRALSWAMLAHLALLAALAWGVSWKREATVSTVEAELWSRLPQQAAPKLQETAPPPAPQAEKSPEPPAQKTPEIAVEKEKPKPKIEPKPEAKPALKVDKAAEDHKLAAQREKERLDNIQRAAGLAGASGTPNATGQSMQSASISASYGARIRARVLPNHVFTGDTNNNPKVEIQISVDSTGLIQKTKIVKSSGNRMFDESVVRAFEATQTLPRDENGRVPPQIDLTWSARGTN
jgi:colicin import membrane protein